MRFFSVLSKTREEKCIADKRICQYLVRLFYLCRLVVIYVIKGKGFV